jgi:hypothetical protein
MSFEPQSSVTRKDVPASNQKNLSMSSDESCVPDPLADLHAVGGGDPYIAELIRGARLSAELAGGSTSAPQRDELTNFYPPGYEPLK